MFILFLSNTLIYDRTYWSGLEFLTKSSEERKTYDHMR